MQTIIINVFEIISNKAAVSTDAGQKVFERISKAIENGLYVTIDFNNIEIVTSTFLNSAVGQLYGKFENSLLKDRLKVLNLSQDDLVILKKVTDRAKEYFRDKSTIEQAIRKTTDSKEAPDNE